MWDCNAVWSKDGDACSGSCSIVLIVITSGVEQYSDGSSGVLDEFSEGIIVN